MTANRQVTLPARIEGLIARDLGEEIVVLDPKTQQAHRLTGRDAEAWREAGTSTTDEGLVAHAARLQALGLLDAKGVSRRQLLARAGMVAAAAPLASLALPMAQAAASVTAVTVNSVTCTRNSPTSGQSSISAINYTVTTRENHASYTISFTPSPTNPNVIGGPITDSGQEGNNTNTKTGNATAATAANNLVGPSGTTQTIQVTVLDQTTNNTFLATVQVTFC